MLCAIVLLVFQNAPLAWLDARILPADIFCFWVGAALTAGGILFSIWARHHLGSNWSQAVTVKKDHQLITGGPYSLVRHPIYSGLLLALLGSAVALGKWRGLLAVAIVFAVLWYKLRLEEKWMRATFGEAYETYAHPTSALIPFVF